MANATAPPASLIHPWTGQPQQAAGGPPAWSTDAQVNDADSPEEWVKHTHRVEELQIGWACEFTAEEIDPIRVDLEAHRTSFEPEGMWTDSVRVEFATDCFGARHFGADEARALAASLIAAAALLDGRAV